MPHWFEQARGREQRGSAEAIGWHRAAKDERSEPGRRIVRVLGVVCEVERVGGEEGAPRVILARPRQQTCFVAWSEGEELGFRRRAYDGAANDPE